MINACYGLDETGARAASTTSSLTVGGLVKHLVRVEREWIGRLSGPSSAEGEVDLPAMMEKYLAGFRLSDDETLGSVLDDYRAAGESTDAAIACEVDLARTIPVPPMPWFPAGDGCSVRWILLHLIEETARHAGHADIIRESLDGADSGRLMAAVEGWPEDGWITPWRPVP